MVDAAVADLNDIPGTPPGEAALNCCANCKAVLAGPYCHVCGQADRDLERSVGFLIAEAAQHLFHADGRLLHTVPELIFRPADLTREYLVGRRASQTPPLRLFLVLILLLFFVGAMRGVGRAPAPLFQKDTPSETVLTVGPRHSAAQQDFAAWLNPRLNAASAHPGEFRMAVEAWLHRLAIAFLPIMTLILGLLFVFQRRFFLFDHAIFSMHSLAFMALLFSLVTLLGMVPPVRGLAALLVLAAPAHLFVHLRGVYGASVLGALIRMFLLLALSALAMGSLLLAVIGVELNGLPIA